MRLINTETLKLDQFFDSQIPEYAILSHTWERDELTYQDMQKLVPHIQQKAGYMKAVDCCKLARAQGYKYIWIDTCCIDKTSSAELSEAINSMFRWYQNAKICYVYLPNVPCTDVPQTLSSFRESRWFKRGWTLQELIAPDSVEFYSKNWTYLGTKLSLRQTISEITGIEIRVLEGASLQSICVGKKMYWASSRVTTRLEDEAYCLMGLFNVNMPLLYGEGKKAFIRLQEEIKRNVYDHTLFAWFISAQQRRRMARLGITQMGLLARSSRDFRYSENVVPLPNHEAEPYELTNRGVRMEIPLYNQGTRFFAALDCAFNKFDGLERHWLLLSRQTSPSAKENSFTRVGVSREEIPLKIFPDKLCSDKLRESTLTRLHIKSHVDRGEVSRNGVEFLVHTSFTYTGYFVAAMYPDFAWDNIDNLNSKFSISTLSLTRPNGLKAKKSAEMSSEGGVIGALLFRNQYDSTKCFALLFGSSSFNFSRYGRPLYEFKDLNEVDLGFFGHGKMHFDKSVELSVNMERTIRSVSANDNVEWAMELVDSSGQFRRGGTYVVNISAQKTSIM